MSKRRLGTLTHDYKRHGTTTLFAAVNVLDGTVIGKNMQHHCHQEFIRKPASSIPLSTSRPPSQPAAKALGVAVAASVFVLGMGGEIGKANSWPCDGNAGLLDHQRAFLGDVGADDRPASSGPPANDLHSAFGDS